jgi:nucleoside-diphosphate-sugar epimerase
LLDSEFEDEIVCLVRADDQESAEARVRRSIARFGRPSRLPRNVTVLRGDMLSHEWHDSRALDNVSHVLHLAANTSFGNNPGIRRTNVEGALSVAKSMRGRNLERYLHVGTATICGVAAESVVHEDDYPNPAAEHLLPYTRSKAEAEMLLAERYADLPITIARPSIVVGDTRYGCKPSGSIFWVLRTLEALRFLGWNPDNRVDVVPVDWAANALTHLLFKPVLEHKRYHVSAGCGRSITWRELGAEYARIYGGPAEDRYEVGDIHSLTSQRFRQAIGPGNARYLRQALELYSRFCSLDLVFDNSRILKAGIPAPPRFTDYMRVCVESSSTGIYEQMRVDLEASLALV